MPAAYGCNQFLNWLQPYGFALAKPAIESSHSDFYLFQDSNPIKCQMPAAFGGNQFKNRLQPYGFALAKPAIESSHSDQDFTKVMSFLLFIDIKEEP